jgi:hypothetical protein
MAAKITPEPVALTRFGYPKTLAWLSADGTPVLKGTTVSTDDGTRYIARGLNTHIALRTPMVNCAPVKDTPLIVNGRTVLTINIPASSLTLVA